MHVLVVLFALAIKCANAADVPFGIPTSLSVTPSIFSGACASSGPGGADVVSVFDGALHFFSGGARTTSVPLPASVGGNVEIAGSAAAVGIVESTPGADLLHVYRASAWTNFSIPQARAGAGLGAVSPATLVVVGGRDGSVGPPVTGTLFVNATSGVSWTGGSVTESRTGHVPVTVGNRWIASACGIGSLLGAGNSAMPVGGIDVWDSASGGSSWQYFAVPGQPRFYCAATSLGDALFIAGGTTDMTSFPVPVIQDIVVFDFDQASGAVSQQRTLQLQVARSNMVAFATSSVAMFVGGSSGDASSFPDAWRNGRAIEWYDEVQQAMQIDSATAVPAGTVPKPQTYLPVDVACCTNPICTDAAGNAYIFARDTPVYVLPAPPPQQATTAAASVATTTAPAAGTTTSTATRNPSTAQDSAAASQRAAVATALFAAALLAIA